MSEIYAIWANDANDAQARFEIITKGKDYRVLRRGRFPLIQTEDLDAKKSLTSEDERYCVIFELM